MGWCLMSAGTVAMATGLHPGTLLVPEAAQTRSFDLAKEGEEKVGGGRGGGGGERRWVRAASAPGTCKWKTTLSLRQIAVIAGYYANLTNIKFSESCGGMQVARHYTDLWYVRGQRCASGCNTSSALQLSILIHVISLCTSQSG